MARVRASVIRAPSLTVVTALSARGFSLAAGLAMNVAIARALSLRQAGEMFVVFTLITAAATVGRFGGDNLLLRSVSADRPGLRQLGKQVAIVVLFASTLAAALLMALTWALLGFDTDGLHAGSAAALAVLPASASVTAGAVLRGSGRIGLGTIAELGSAPALATVGIVGLALTHQASRMSILFVLVAAYWFTAIWAVAAAQRPLPTCHGASLDLTGFVREHRKTLTAFCVTSVGFFLFVWTPILVLGVAGSEEDVALYNSAARIAAFVALVPTIQISYLAPRFAKMYAVGQIPQLNRITQSATRQGVIVAGIIAVFLALFPELVLQLFGNGYVAAKPALIVLSLGALLVVCLGPVNGLMLTCGLEGQASRFILFVTLAGALLVYALAGSGVGLVALANTLAILAYSIACAVSLWRIGVRSALAPRRGPC